MKHIWLLIATFFRIGNLPIAPGTWASLATAALVWFIQPYHEASLPIQIAVILAIFLLGIPAASYSEKHYDKKDPGHCVIDEVVGQMVTLLLVPHNLLYYIGGFFLFRFFDIIKPFPIRNLEKIPGGLGIMVDDVGAGLYSLGFLHLGIYVYTTYIL